MAEDLIAVGGMEGLRLTEVARAVGVRPPSLFAHFAGREAIGDAVAQRVIARLDAVFDAALDDAERDPRRALCQGVRAFAAHLYDHPTHVRMLLRDLARVRGGGEIDLSSPVITRLAQRIQRLIDRGAAAGVFRPRAAGRFMGQIEGAILASIAWDGFGESGEPLTRLTRDEAQADAEALALALLGSGRPASG